MNNRQEEVGMDVKAEFAALNEALAKARTATGSNPKWEGWFAQLAEHLEKGEKLWDEQEASEWVELSVGDGWHRVSPDGEKWQYRLTEDQPWVSGEGADWLSPSVKAYRKGYEVGKQEEQEWGGQGEWWAQLKEHFDLDDEDMDCAGDVAHWIITHIPSAKQQPGLLDELEDQEDTIEVLREVVKTQRKELDKAIAHDRQPYPTAEAYEKVCAALQSHKDKVQELVRDILDYNPNIPRQEWCRAWQCRIYHLAKELK
jgi:hypothetical protein